MNKEAKVEQTKTFGDEIITRTYLSENDTRNIKDHDFERTYNLTPQYPPFTINEGPSPSGILALPG